MYGNLIHTSLRGTCNNNTGMYSVRYIQNDKLLCKLLICTVERRQATDNNVLICCPIACFQNPRYL